MNAVDLLEDEEDVWSDHRSQDNQVLLEGVLLFASKATLLGFRKHCCSFASAPELTARWCWVWTVQARQSSTQQLRDSAQAEMAERLLDRLQDCKRTFPVAAVLGGAAESVLKRLRGTDAGIEQVYYIDQSPAMLERGRKALQVTAGASPESVCTTHGIWSIWKSSPWGSQT